MAYRTVSYATLGKKAATTSTLHPLELGYHAVLVASVQTDVSRTCEILGRTSVPWERKPNVTIFGNYSESFPNTRDSGQLARVASRKNDIKEKLRRWESTVGSYSRDGNVVPQDALAVYIGLNPRSLNKANRNLLVELATRIANGDLDFNPVSVALTEVHRATDRKFFVDFDFDDAEPDNYDFEEVLPTECWKILKTRGGFHLIIELAKIKEMGIKSNWYKAFADMPKVDVKGTNNLTPVPGCTQGGFVPRFWEAEE